MLGILGNGVPVEFFLLVFICVFLIGYFIYKEWPEFKRRMSGGAKAEADATNEARTTEARVTRLETRVDEISDMLSRDYIRLNMIEKLSRANAKAIKDSLEERRIIMEALLGCLKALQKAGANGETERAIREINDYLNRQAHNNQAIEEDSNAPKINPNV